MSHVALLPYFPKLEIDLKVNRLHIFNFLNLGETYIPNREVRQRVDRYCSIFVSDSGERLPNPAIAVLDGKYDFAGLSEVEISDIFKYSDALLFTSVLKNRGHAMCVSEQFSTYIIPVIDTAAPEPEENYITYPFGSYYRVLDTRLLDTTKIVKPLFIPPNTNPYFVDTNLLGALANLIDARDQIDNRFHRALEWIRYAHLNADGFSQESRAVMLATAFEIFFDLGRKDKKKNFANKLESLIEVASFNIPQFEINPTNPRLGFHTAYGRWAREFYDLRSTIVHGSEVTRQVIRNRNDKLHFNIAVRMLQFCFYMMLEDLGYLKYDSGETQPPPGEVPFRRIHTIRTLRKIESMIE